MTKEIQNEIEHATLTVHPYPRTCVLCEHFHIYASDESFQEDNDAAYFNCAKGYWYISSWEESISPRFRLAVLQAENCEHFEDFTVKDYEQAYYTKIKGEVEQFRQTVEERREELK